MATGLGRGRERNRDRDRDQNRNPFVSSNQPGPAVSNGQNGQNAAPKPVNDIGISASLFDDYFNIFTPRPVIQVAQPISAIRREANNPAIREYEVGANHKKVNEQDQKKYVEKVTEEEHKSAVEFLFNPNRSRVQARMEIDGEDDTVSNANDLDGVSTCLEEVNSLLDPGFRQALEPFFTSRRGNFSTEELPIASKQKAIINQIKINRVTIIKGTTGCGKTTQVPQYIMDDCFARKANFNIVVTQPRRIAAKTVAERVCAERDWKCGEVIGYQVGMDKQANELTRLLYCTTGVLLQKLISEKKMDNYTHIIIDEIHERNDETDLLIMVVRKFLWSQGAPVKVILMSATFDTTKFSKYFTLTDRGRNIEPAVIEIKESFKPILKQYIDQLPPQWFRDIGCPDNSYLEFDKDDPQINRARFLLCPVLIDHFESIEKESRGMRQSGRGAVLVFLPGFEDIKQMWNLLEKHNRAHKTLWWILPLHSSITLDEQKKVFQASTKGERKVILATNIAESSITVPDVEYIIDYCLTKNLVCDSVTRYPTLRLEWASHTNCDQRAGRCGRVVDGRVFRMVTSQFYHQYMSKEGLPELLRTPLENSILKVKKLDLGPPKRLLALCIDYPNLSDIKTSIIRLKRVGAMTIKMDGIYDDEDGNLTFLGKMMADLPLDVQLAKFVMMGYVFDCLDDCIIIAACLSLQNIFTKPFDQAVQAYKARLAWSERSFSDPLAYWYAYKQYYEMLHARQFEKGSPLEKKWCGRNFIQQKRLRDVDTLVTDLRKRLEFSGVSFEPRPNKPRDPFTEQVMLKVVIALSFYPFYYLQNPASCPDDIRKQLNEKDPRNTVKLSGLPANQGILYANQIRKAISEVADTVDMEFEETHCFLTFPSDADPLAMAENLQSSVSGEGPERGSIIPHDKLQLRTKRKRKDREVETEVYLAVKMSRQGDPISILKYKPQIAEQRLQKCSEIRDSKATRAKYFRTNRFRVPAYTSCKIPDARLPPKCLKRIDIFVTEIDSVGYFWAQYRDNKTTEMLLELQNAYQKVKADGSYKTPQVGDMLLVPYSSDGKGPVEINRARVIRVDRSNGIFNVFFIDYGGVGELKLTESINCSKLDPLKMPASLFSIPALAMECRLCELKHSPGRVLHQFDDMHKFRSLVDNNYELFAMVYSVVNRVISLKLFRGKQDNGLSINDILLTEGIMVKCDESALSQADAALRINTQGSPQEAAPIYTSEDYCDIDPPYHENEEKYLGANSFLTHDSPFVKERITLRGPMSPIEVKFSGTTHKDSTMTVSVDQDSVNSVCLDPDPVNSSRRLLVAGVVTLAQTSKQIIARSTTLMPDVRGFPGIMALIAAPRYEMRCNIDRTRYLGAICGLGYDEESKRSYDPDHDIEIAFDCFIDDKDLANISIVRFHISDILSSEENFHTRTGQGLFHKQDKIREKIGELLAKNRRPLPIKTLPKHEWKWGVLTRPDMLGAVETLDYDPILPTIKTVIVIDSKKYKDTIAENLENLKSMLQLRLNNPFTCELCDVKTWTYHEMESHALSNEHVSKVKELFEQSEWKLFEYKDEFTKKDFRANISHTN